MRANQSNAGLAPCLAVVMTFFMITGCKQHPRSSTQPADLSSQAHPTTRPAPASQPPKPASRPTTAPASQPTALIKPPKRPVDSWTIFRVAFEDGADVTCTSSWTGGNRLEIVTENISRLTLDLNKLPPGAPTKGPWNLQIDKQGIQITGLRGKVLDLVRSPNGVWSVDKNKAPTRRRPPTRP